MTDEERNPIQAIGSSGQPDAAPQERLRMVCTKCDAPAPEGYGFPHEREGNRIWQRWYLCPKHEAEVRAAQEAAAAADTPARKR